MRIKLEGKEEPCIPSSSRKNEIKTHKYSFYGCSYNCMDLLWNVGYKSYKELTNAAVLLRKVMFSLVLKRLKNPNLKHPGSTTKLGCNPKHAYYGVNPTTMRLQSNHVCGCAVRKACLFFSFVCFWGWGGYKQLTNEPLVRRNLRIWKEFNPVCKGTTCYPTGTVT